MSEVHQKGSVSGYRAAWVGDRGNKSVFICLINFVQIDATLGLRPERGSSLFGTRNDFDKGKTCGTGLMR